MHCIKTIAIIIFTFIAIPSLFAEDRLQMHVFKGEAITPYIKAITDLSLIIYKEPPYLYEGTEEEYGPFIEHYTRSRSSIACLLFDQGKPVGIAIGMPMNEMREKYKEPFTKARPQENGDQLFYLGEFLLLKEYRKQGHRKQLYVELERLVRKAGFKKICSCDIVEPDQTTLMQKKSLDGFWRRLGFEKCEDITATVFWQNVSETDVSPHHMVYWVKNLY